MADRSASSPLHARRALELQRLVGNRMTAGLLAGNRSPIPTERSIQRAWADHNYDVSATPRTLAIDVDHAVAWGGAVDAGGPERNRSEDRPRAILYETMTTEDGLDDLLGRFRAGPGLDIGLSVVVNGPYTPPNGFDAQGKNATKIKKTQGDALVVVKGRLANRAQGVLNGWTGPPLKVVTAAWERRELRSLDENKLETIQSSVPYSQLRFEAAANPGNAAIDASLSRGHTAVWHRMGDSDMPIVNPNGVEREIKKIAEVEALPLNKTQVVTFGYNLTTDGLSDQVAGALRLIYAKEMQLRDEMFNMGLPIYPSEPTTYYRPVVARGVDAAWQVVDRQKVGGSGQQLEGAKLAMALQATTGYSQFAFHTVQLNTSAGRRNNAIVAILNQWWNNGNPAGVPDQSAALDAAINQLDQSALRDGEYADKVLKYLIAVKPVNDLQVRQIAPLVTSYREKAVAEVKRYLLTGPLITAMMQERNARWDLSTPFLANQ